MCSTESKPSRTFSVGFVGGASGVGKTTVLKGLPSIVQISTGTLFKECMQLDNRDEIRNRDWTDYEDQVSDILIERAVECLGSHRPLVVDTHFAAKLAGRSYRIGLRPELLLSFWRVLFDVAHQAEARIEATIALVYCHPSELLKRRRLDTSRNREIVPSDCIAALSENQISSKDYLQQAFRAERESSNDSQHTIRYLLVENINLEAAVRLFTDALMRGQE